MTILREGDIMKTFIQCCIGAGLALLGFIGIGYGLGVAGAAALEGIARQPEATDRIANVLFFLIVIPELILAFLLAKVALRIHNCGDHKD
jgi:F0F1-type ATP synthase membrane subunit c/vacuolar-type H+-ATPase subunit K